MSAVGFNTGQKLAYQHINEGHNLVIIGQAGTGKSFAIKEIVEKLQLQGKFASSFHVSLTLCDEACILNTL
jgi:tRNA A37 threonylcarbamoyladenosine biosynthesis protein TsaE